MGHLMENLLVLQLAKNNLSAVSTHWFSNLNKLLYENQLTSVPEDIFQNLPNLKEIGLHGNKIAELSPNLFPHKDKLNKLLLENNLLTGLPEGFFVGFPQLKTLTLQKNKLTSLPPVLDADLFEKLASVVTLRLAHNDLHTLPEDIFDPLLKLKKLYLSDNPWRCDCNLIPLHLWIKANSDKIQSAAVLKPH
ncbi:Platelet glycoprotein V [Dissostichus eleginoides]|uniref:Platelet glycoprotein V n=1 Tax=Dissostichus eleginoides TaxID=100907 RepID=A0AAD9C8P6_DISEL|nr:Platelet glycoprotein V [Dissostichus eleginoides]